MMPVVLGMAVVLAIIAIALLMNGLRARREQYIRTYSYPPGLFDRLSKRHPELAFKDIALISRALRHFFLAHMKSGGQFVSMPSQVVDDLWHEFILHTKNYEVFCRHAFGGFLHHTPAAALGAQRRDNAGLRRVWWWCCLEENIDPRRPSRLPLLFALDAKLAISNGFRYATDCRALRDPATPGTTTYCGGDFSDGSFVGGTEGFGDGGNGGPGGHGNGSSDAGGSDGGSGCGGGGCGGGGGGD